jgi:polar amino acid transport system permease protein
MSDWELLWAGRGLLLNGLIATLVLSAAAIVTSTVIGFLVGFARYQRIPVLSPVLRVYLEIFRGSPLLIQLLFVYFGAAYLRIDWIGVFAAGVIAITLYQGAYISEVFRAGFESVSPGQREAAKTLGLSNFHINKDVILPQTWLVVLPPLFGQYLTLIKNTTLVSVIGYSDIVRNGTAIIERGANSFTVYLVIAVLFFAFNYPLSVLARWMETRIIRRRGEVA